MRKLRDIVAEREKAAQDDRDLRSRTDARTERKREADTLIDLAVALTSLTPKQLRGLDLGDQVLSTVLDAQLIDSAPARNRQHKLIRRALNDVDAEAIARRVEALRSPTRANPAPVSKTTLRRRANEAKARALVEGGDPAIDALAAAHPELDRSRLRQLVRNLKREPGSAPALRRVVEVIARFEPTSEEPPAEAAIEGETEPAEGDDALQTRE